MKTKDVIIIGAGPAGCMAGYHLAEAGLDVLIIEKASFPRRKVCGGGLTQRAFHEIPFDISPVIHHQINWGYLSFGGREVAEIGHDKPIAYLVDRASFDNFLLENAVQHGAACALGERFLSLSKKDGYINVNTNKGVYACRYLIGAGGVHSQVAKSLDLCQSRSLSLAYEARLELPKNRSNPPINTITFDFGTLLWGYGWIFPKRDHINAGVFRSFPGKRTSKRQLVRFIQQHPRLRQLAVRDIRAYPGPLGGKAQILNKDNTLLVGDAANLVDPWLGEGLYYAIASGRMAAESIIVSERENREDLSHYSSLIHSTFTPQFISARKLSIGINLLPLINVLALKASPTLQEMIIDLLQGTSSHTQIWERLKGEFPSLTWKILNGK